MQTMNWPAITVRNALVPSLGHISLAGFGRADAEVPRRPFRVLGSFAVAYVVDGSGYYEDASGLDVRVQAGDMLLVFPDLAHAYGPEKGSSWTELYLVFDGPVFELWRSSGILNQAAPIHHLQPISHWMKKFESILGVPHQTGYAPPLLEICRLQTVLGEALVDSTTGGEQDEEAAWTARACMLLEPEARDEASLRDIACEMKMSYDGFRKRFARNMKVSPSRYRSTRLIDRACELMQQSNLTDKQIAEHLGFCDQFYFSRRFKEITGRSPRHFRASLPPMR